MYPRAMKRARKRRGLTQTELAERLGMAPSAISRYESGVRQPGMDTMKAICHELDVTMDELREAERRFAGDEDTAKAPATKASGVVGTKADITTWRSLVLGDRDLSDGAQLVLVGLPLFLDKTNLIVVTNSAEFSENTGRGRELVSSAWSEVISSKYVERIGSVEYVLRLIFP